MSWIIKPHRQAALIAELQTLARLPNGQARLAALRKQAAAFSSDPEWVWSQLILAFSTVQARGDANWNRAKSLLPTAPYSKYAGLLTEQARIAALSFDLKSVGYRFPNRTYRFLAQAIALLAPLGGPSRAVASMPGRTEAEKIGFLSAFPGISAKYARNIWMDIDPASLSHSFALDSNLLQIIHVLYAQVPRGVHPTKINAGLYSIAESELGKIAKAAGLSCWEADRLMYYFNNKLIAAMVASGP